MLDAAGGRALGVERWVDRPDADVSDPFIGRTVGSWRIVDLLGHGGMGRVYLAERADGQFDQHVALKVAAFHPAADIGAATFHAERRTLARLSHPHVARLLDAGLTAEGSAYLVMEYVDGLPLTRHCDEHRLSIDDRLRLFRTVCEAVQHAHASLVVHRDLKPSNIFVSRAGDVKLLDFGIAKLLSADGERADATTRGDRQLTPGYAAPEQCRGLPVTTAADVYALGVVLFELLVGRRPYTDDVAAATVAWPDRGIDTPTAPSALVQTLARTDPTSAADTARKRATTPDRLTRRLAGDVDTVVLKALQAAPSDRYESAGQFGEDIVRLLEGQPVVARPATFAYRATRFVTRHRLAVAAATAALALLLAFAVVTMYQARQLALERDRAQIEAERASRVVALLSDLFELAEPGAGRGASITARELLDRGTARIEGGLAGDVPSQAVLYGVVGRIYANLGLHGESARAYERVAALADGDGAQGAVANAGTLQALAMQYVLLNDYAGAEARYREVLALLPEAQGAAHERAEALEGLGRVLSMTGRHADAIPPLREALALRRADADAGAAVLMSALHELGLALHRGGELAEAEHLAREAVAVGAGLPDTTPARYTATLHLARLVHQFNRDAAGAEPIYEEALALARRLHAGDHQDVAVGLGERARNQRDLGHLAAAEASAREARAMFERLYGLQHREVLIATQTLAGIVGTLGRHDEAEQLQRDALTTARGLLGEAHPLTLSAQRALAEQLEGLGRLSEATALREAELATAVAALGEYDVYVAIALAGLGRHHMAAGRADAAEVYLRRAVAVREHLHPTDHWRVAEARAALGVCLTRRGHFTEAEVLLAGAHRTLVDARGPSAQETQRVIDGLIDLYEVWGRREQATRIRGLRNADGAPRMAASP
jgi:eukaryotic-like serine/threonine-protein kinase